MLEFSPMQVSLWINKLNPNFKQSLVPLGLSCASHLHQIKVDESLIRAATNFYIPSRHVFQFNGIELCPTIEESDAIMGEWDFGSTILSTLEENLSELAHKFLGISQVMAKRWCKPRKLNISMVISYFFKKALPLAGIEHAYFLNAYCLCILVGIFLVHSSHRMDSSILHVVQHLWEGSPVPIILAETLNGLDVVHKEEANFFSGSHLLLQI